MRKGRKIGALLIILAVVIMQLPAGLAEAADSADFVMEGMALSSYKGKDKTVSIPAGVESIGERAFEDNRTMEKVVFPGSLKRIGAYAFWGCDALTDVSFGKGLKEISDFAFTNCSGLEKLTIPSTISYIGVQAFADCVNLTDITIPANVIYIHESAFDGCSQLVIHCEEGSYASEYAKEFYRRQADFPEREDSTDTRPGTESPGESPLPPSDTENPQDQDILGSTSVVGNQAVLLLDNRKPSVQQGTPSQGQETADPLKYRIVDGWCVADQAYYRARELREVSLPQGIREIGEFAYARSGVESLALQPGVEKICYGAFYHCDELGEVTLPDTIETVEPKAFDHTRWVEDFRNGRSEASGDFLISGGVLVSYRGQGGEVRIPEGVRVIAAECFQGMKEIREVIFPKGLKNIGEGAFEGCSSLSEVQWNEDLEKISDRAFSGCGLKEATLPDAVAELGTFVFDPSVRVLPEGKEIRTTYETTAQRLSNAAYRGLDAADSDSAPGEREVLTLGMEGARAELDGADRSYTLTLQEETGEETISRAAAAFQRNLGSPLPGNARCISCVLSDSSKIPLTKLGKQTLHITLPITGTEAGQVITVYQYDRNGQLKKVSARYPGDGGEGTISFDVTNVYDLILVPAG